jgi:hypothetical protein
MTEYLRQTNLTIAQHATLDRLAQGEIRPLPCADRVAHNLNANGLVRCFYSFHEHGWVMEITDAGRTAHTEFEEGDTDD